MRWRVSSMATSAKSDALFATTGIGQALRPGDVGWAATARGRRSTHSIRSPGCQRRRRNGIWYENRPTGG
jgi:hypothetical protein